MKKKFQLNKAELLEVLLIMEGNNDIANHVNIVRDALSKSHDSLILSHDIRKDFCKECEILLDAGHSYLYGNKAVELLGICREGFKNSDTIHIV